MTNLPGGRPWFRRVAHAVSRLLRPSTPDVRARHATQASSTKPVSREASDSRPAVDKEIRILRTEIQELRRELHGRLVQYHHQLGRLTRAVERGGEPADAEGARLSGRTVPMDAPDEMGEGWVGFDDGEVPPDPHGLEWLTLTSCPLCGGLESTVMNPWNKFVLTQKAPDESSAVYDYSVCHQCGVLFAARRPVGDRYRFLLSHYGETTAKRGGGAYIANRVLNPYPLSEHDRAELRRLATPGIYVSDHRGVANKDFLVPLLRDRLENAVHVELLGALLEPRGARVLEVRSRAGTILEGLRRAWGADVYAMPIWESQQFILREVLGIPTSDLIDFERFEIPFEGVFDLIVCNHQLTHALQPQAFFAELRRKLKPGGHIYLYTEPDDAEYLDGNQSMFATLNPLHMQAFDQASLVRGLAANGFEAVFMKRRGHQHLALARQVPSVAMTPISQREREARLERYRQAFDRSVLGVDESLRGRVVAHWATAVERAVASGSAEYDERGQLRLVSR